MNGRELTTRAYLETYLSLLILLALTVWARFVDFGSWTLAISLGIAFAKGLLILLFFMHLKPAQGILRLTAAIGLGWLAVLIGLVLADYATRGAP